MSTALLTTPHAEMQATPEPALEADVHAGPLLSIVMPVYQESDIIEQSLTRTMAAMGAANVTYEVIVVDDGSTDGTRAILEALQQTHHAHLRVITHPYNKGNGSSVKTGIRAAQGEVIACMDADGQHAPQDVLRMLPYLQEYDLVVGARTELYQGAWYRTLANRFYNTLASRLTEFPIQDLTSGFRLFRASIIKEYVHLLPARFSYPTTSTLIFIKAGYNVKYVPIHMSPRQGGESKVKVVRDGWIFLLIIFKVIVLFEPLRIFMPVALMSFIFALMSMGHSIWLLGRLRIPNSAVAFLITAVIVLLLGLVAEQLAALQLSIRSRRE